MPRVRIFKINYTATITGFAYVDAINAERAEEKFFKGNTYGEKEEPSGYELESIEEVKQND